MSVYGVVYVLVRVVKDFTAIRGFIAMFYSNGTDCRVTAIRDIMREDFLNEEEKILTQNVISLSNFRSSTVEEDWVPYRRIAY